MLNRTLRDIISGTVAFDVDSTIPSNPPIQHNPSSVILQSNRAATSSHVGDGFATVARSPVVNSENKE